ncbi:hypothetical protein [Natrialba sp. INN-245]|uniref:capsular polysaccharide export protein, LipB/KpsS family n=1 Tax=Natrialba sp. INN-245 TaxID=2690967 RepID=UPI001311D47A|nr:hypothetical protein [Natrialba sp. INN-245]MWV40047.1 hypothetical protein [Natrialba sp. INN-245]
MSDSLAGKKFILAISSKAEIAFSKKLLDSIESQSGSALILPDSKKYLKLLNGTVSSEYIISEHLCGEPTQSLEYLVSKYQISSCRSQVFPDMVYGYMYPKPSGEGYFFNRPSVPEYRPYINRFHQLLDTLDRVYEDGFQAIPLQNQGAGIHTQALEAVANYHGIKSVRFSFNPLPGRVTVKRGKSMDFPELATAMDEPLSESERKRAQSYRQGVLDTKPQVGTSTSRPHVDSAKQMLNNAYRYLQIIHREKTAALPEVENWFRRKVGKRALARIQQFWSKTASESYDLIRNNDYVFYSIQYHRESRVTMRAPAFYDQAAFVEYLSRCVPCSNDLYVKDHPQQLGALSTSDVRHISQYAGLLAPNVSSHDIIREANAILTLNNTVGHEAIIWGKPVVALGDALYSDLQFVESVDDINALPASIAAAMDSGSPTEKEILRYINGLYQISEPVDWGDSSDGNVLNLTDFLQTVGTS